MCFSYIKTIGIKASINKLAITKEAVHLEKQAIQPLMKPLTKKIQSRGPSINKKTITTKEKDCSVKQTRVPPKGSLIQEIQSKDHSVLMC